MSNDLEDRLRAALHAVEDAPARPGAYERNLQRLQAGRRTARGAVVAAAAAAVVGVLAVPVLELDRDDTLRPASPGDTDQRPDGEVAETLTAFDRDFDLIEQEGRMGYTVCTSQPPYACAAMPVLRESGYTGLAVPVDEGAVLMLGSRGDPQMIADDLIVTGRTGAEPFQPPVEFVDSEVLGYRLAVLEVPTFERAYCVASHENGVGKSYTGIAAVSGPVDGVC